MPRQAPNVKSLKVRKCCDLSTVIMWSAAKPNFVKVFLAFRATGEIIIIKDFLWLKTHGKETEKKNVRSKKMSDGLSKYIVNLTVRKTNCVFHQWRTSWIEIDKLTRWKLHFCQNRLQRLHLITDETKSWNTGLSFRKLLQLLNCIERRDKASVKAKSFDSLGPTWNRA